MALNNNTPNKRFKTEDDMVQTWGQTPNRQARSVTYVGGAEATPAQVDVNGGGIVDTTINSITDELTKDAAVSVENFQMMGMVIKDNLWKTKSFYGPGEEAIFELNTDLARNTDGGMIGFLPDRMFLTCEIEPYWGGTADYDYEFDNPSKILTHEFGSWTCLETLDIYLDNNPAYRVQNVKQFISLLLMDQVPIGFDALKARTKAYLYGMGYQNYFIDPSATFDDVWRPFDAELYTNMFDSKYTELATRQAYFMQFVANKPIADGALQFGNLFPVRNYSGESTGRLPYNARPKPTYIIPMAGIDMIFKQKFLSFIGATSGNQKPLAIKLTFTPEYNFLLCSQFPSLLGAMSDAQWNSLTYRVSNLRILVPYWSTNNYPVLRPVSENTITRNIHYFEKLITPSDVNAMNEIMIDVNFKSERPVALIGAWFDYYKDHINPSQEYTNYPDLQLKDLMRCDGASVKGGYLPPASFGTSEIGLQHVNKYIDCYNPFPAGHRMVIDAGGQRYPFGIKSDEEATFTTWELISMQFFQHYGSVRAGPDYNIQYVPHTIPGSRFGLALNGLHWGDDKTVEAINTRVNGFTIIIKPDPRARSSYNNNTLFELPTNSKWILKLFILTIGQVAGNVVDGYLVDANI